MPEISVIVPVYKAEKTLSRCVDSILHQTLQDIELILVDDGSPDRSGAICDEYAGLDSRVRVIHKPNGGAASARNAALEIVAGKYIMFCDSDDYVSPEWCRWMLDAMESGDMHTAICGVESVFSDGSKVRQGVMQTRIAEQSELIAMASNVSLYITCNKIFKTALVKQHHLRFDEELKRCEDIFFTMRYLMLIGPGERITYGSEALYHYIRQDGSLSRSYMKNLWPVECRRLAMTCELLRSYGISEDAYAPYYSVRAAYSVSEGIANLFSEQDQPISTIYRELREIVSSPEYAAAISGGGIRQVAGGPFCKLLEMKQTIPILLYCLLSRQKNKKTRR